MPGSGAQTSAPFSQDVPSTPSEADLRDVEGAKILARAGSQVVLASEVNAAVNELFNANKDRMTKSQMEGQRKLLTKKLLQQRIEVKLVLEDALRNIPSENLEMVHESLAEEFEEKEVPSRIEQAELQSRRELEERLGKLGTSLEREKRAFIERMIAQHRIGEVVRAAPGVPNEDVLAEYQKNLAEYEHKPRARWEQLTVRKSKHPDPSEALAMLARMGNDVKRGVPFAQVAQRHSEDMAASEGGLHDWVTQGSLVSAVMDQAVFGLPVGQMSRILEDDEGYHIVRVIEREDAYTTPFSEAQDEIRKRLGREQRKECITDYLARLREEIPVWTVFDEKTADGRSGAAEISRRW
jgi:parvulin-like peptidyl-prolyl isomerase